MARSGDATRGVMDLMLAARATCPTSTRRPASFEAVGDERLAELEARCPARVPMRELAAFVRAKAAEMSSVREQSVRAGSLRRATAIAMIVATGGCGARTPGAGGRSAQESGPWPREAPETGGLRSP